jgi:hypothetical protein
MGIQIINSDWRQLEGTPERKKIKDALMNYQKVRALKTYSVRWTNWELKELGEKGMGYRNNSSKPACKVVLGKHLKLLKSFEATLMDLNIKPII